jgi:hypothetical protein
VEAGRELGRAEAMGAAMREEGGVGGDFHGARVRGDRIPRGGSGGGTRGTFFGAAGTSFLAQFGRAEMRTPISTSHVGRAERPFSVQVGSAQIRKPA